VRHGQRRRVEGRAAPVDPQPNPAVLRDVVVGADEHRPRRVRHLLRDGQEAAHRCDDALGAEHGDRRHRRRRLPAVEQEDPVDLIVEAALFVAVADVAAVVEPP
jgi:hypothetical protein